MPKITDKPLEAIQVRLFKEDLDVLRTLYKGQAFGVNKLIRTIVSIHVRQINARANAQIDQTERFRQLDPIEYEQMLAVAAAEDSPP